MNKVRVGWTARSATTARLTSRRSYARRTSEVFATLKWSPSALRRCVDEPTSEVSPELSVGWIDPWLGRVGSIFFSFRWVGLGWVYYTLVCVYKVEATELVRWGLLRNGCLTNNLSNKNFYVHIISGISTFVNMKRTLIVLSVWPLSFSVIYRLFYSRSENAYTVVN